MKKTIKDKIEEKRIIPKTVTKVKTCTFRADQPPPGIHLGKASHFTPGKIFMSAACRSYGLKQFAPTGQAKRAESV